MDLQVSLAYRIASGDFDNEVYTWNFTDAANSPVAVVGTGGIATYSDVVTNNPMLDTTFLCTLDSNTITAPGFTTTMDNELNLFVSSAFGDNSTLPPSSYNEVYEDNDSGAGPDITNYFKVIPTSPTGTGTVMTTITTPADNIGYQVGVQPAIQ